MKTLNESIAAAMDCRNTEIVSYLPYILQDFNEIGSSALSILNMIKENADIGKCLNIVDLGCGKGAVSLKIAEELNCRCLGIDGMSEFIEYAQAKAEKENISNCYFVTSDIREEVKKLNPFDVIILGSIGPVFGNYYETMKILNNILTDDGIIILDDGYIEDGQDSTGSLIVNKSELLSQIDKSDMKIVNQYFYDDVSEEYDKELDNIIKRCSELSCEFPDKKHIFDEYVNIQKGEYNNLKNEIVCSAFIIKKKYPGRCKCGCHS